MIKTKIYEQDMFEEKKAILPDISEREILFRCKYSIPSVTISLTSKVPRDRKFSRVGIIPYFIRDGVANFFLAVDAKYSQLTDPGGTRVSSDIDFVYTGCRELSEETLEIFHFMTDSDMDHIYNNTACIYNEKMMIMLMEVTIKSGEAICIEYARRVRSKKSYENSHLIWISDPDLQKLTMNNDQSKVKISSPHLMYLLKPKQMVSLAIQMGEMVVSDSDQRETTISNEITYPPLYPKVRNMLRYIYSNYKSLI